MDWNFRKKLSLAGRSSLAAGQSETTKSDSGHTSGIRVISPGKIIIPQPMFPTAAGTTYFETVQTDGTKLGHSIPTNKIHEIRGLIPSERDYCENNLLNKNGIQVLGEGKYPLHSDVGSVLVTTNLDNYFMVEKPDKLNTTPDKDGNMVLNGEPPRTVYVPTSSHIPVSVL